MFGVQKRNYRDFMSKIEWLVIVAIVLILAALIFPAIDRARADRVPVGTGVVQKKIYSAETHSTGIGFTSSRNGTSPVLVNSSTPEEYVVIIKHEGETFSAKVDANTWGSVDDGTKVEVVEIRGKFWTFGKTIKAP